MALILPRRKALFQTLSYHATNFTSRVTAAAGKIHDNEIYYHLISRDEDEDEDKDYELDGFI